jgi:MEDS: MEthanogen/methylotroph, DcmR Sensory domain
VNAGRHVVQFYRHDAELADRVSDYLLGALEGGGVAIVIATAAHTRAFERRLAAAGVDLAQAARTGAYLALDAAETVRTLMAADGTEVPDQGGFDRVIGGLISGAAGGGGPVRAYGEMVALLWDTGLVNAAIRLEAMWNELGRRHEFSLFCGYSAGSVAGEGNCDAFAEVCRLHQEIVVSNAAASQGAMRTFAFSAEAPAAARHFAVAAVQRWGADDLTDDVALVVTELAANAIVHAHSGFTVTLSAPGEAIRISVRDSRPLPAGAGTQLPTAQLHGLGAVNALASRWGVEPLGPAGKAVWVELRR